MQQRAQSAAGRPNQCCRRFPTTAAGTVPAVGLVDVGRGAERAANAPRGARGAKPGHFAHGRNGRILDNGGDPGIVLRRHTPSGRVIGRVINKMLRRVGAIVARTASTAIRTQRRPRIEPPATATKKRGAAHLSAPDPKYGGFRARLHFLPSLTALDSRPLSLPFPPSFFSVLATITCLTNAKNRSFSS